MLVEVLVVLAIITTLTAIVAFGVIPMYAESKKKAARLSASSLRRVAGTSRMNNTGEECPTFAQLRAKKMIDGESNPNDPWGTPYVIICAEDDVVVISAGPDKKTGTADDIVAPPEAAKGTAL
jgi:type II secretory pathway pseudopilin PulG